MSQALLNIAGNQRLGLSDLTYLAQDQPLGLQADVVGGLCVPAASSAQAYVLSGFATRGGVAGPSSSPAQNQLQVTPGRGILAYRKGADAPLFGVMAVLDSTDQAAQFIDLSNNPAGSYVVWMRLNYAPSALTDKSFWSSSADGYEYAQLTSTRLQASWEIQALGAGSNPGAEWLPIARLTWAAPSTAGGAGSITGLQDTRELYFEGRASSGTPYASAWGNGTGDRSADRSTYGVGDLKTFTDAMRTCIEDIKGPGLRRWWEAGVAGINLGFSPATPTLGRLALGDEALYLQGRTAATAGHAYLTVAVDGSGRRTGWDFAADRTRYILADNNLVTYSGLGTVGFGVLAETDLFGAPGRSVVEVVTSVANQACLRLGARGQNGQVPVGLPARLDIVAPDQSGNLAQVRFGTGGVQGPEASLFAVGKATDNSFALVDSVNGLAFLAYQPSLRSLTLSAAGLTQMDVLNGVTAMTYSTTLRQHKFTGDVVAGGLSVLGGATVVIDMTVGGNLTCNNTLTAATYKTSVGVLATPTTLTVPTQASNAPPAPAYGTMAYFPNADGGRLYAYTAKFYDLNQSDDSLPRGWKRVQLG